MAWKALEDKMTSNIESPVSAPVGDMGFERNGRFIALHNFCHGSQVALLSDKQVACLAGHDDGHHKSLLYHAVGTTGCSNVYREFEINGILAYCRSELSAQATT